MSSAPHFTARVNVSRLVIERDDGRVLLVRKDGEWTLPSVETRGHWHAEVGPINAAVEHQYGVRVVTLRTLAHQLDRQANSARILIAMEVHGEATHAPTGARWATGEELLSAAESADRDGIAAWFGQAAYDDTRPLRRAWTRAGWLDGTLTWCRERLAERGAVISAPPDQVKHWSIASIWRIHTHTGDVWLKTVPPFFAHEGSLIQLIAPTMPEHLPRVIATDRERGLTLMEPLPARTLREQADDAASDRAVALLARLQQSWAPRTAALLAAGCADRRLGTLDSAIEEILARESVRERFNDDELRQLRVFGATVPARVEALRACGVPETLMHGDFYPGNIASDGERLVIFDWTDACVSHPLFDLATFVPRDPVEHAAATQAFLEAWTPAVDMRTLERAAEIAQPLACIHHATSYMRLLDGIDPTDHWEFDSDVLFWLRWLRDLLDAA